MCNQKLIGAQYYNAEWGGTRARSDPTEFLSPRDYNGHGTHTASTAGGNDGVQATGAAAAVRHRQRHRAAGADRGLQGVLVTRRRRLRRQHSRQRRRDRPGGRRRRRRHQLLDQRHVDELPRLGRGRVSCSPPTLASSSPRRRATAARRATTVAHTSPWLTDRRRRHAQPLRHGDGHARQRCRLHRCLAGERGRTLPLIDSMYAGWRARTLPQVALLGAL